MLASAPVRVSFRVRFCLRVTVERTHAHIHDTRGAGRDGLHHPIKIGTIMLNFAQILQILRCVCRTRDRERVCVRARVFVCVLCNVCVYCV